MRDEVARKKNYCENGYISQPIPIATTKKARSDQRAYLQRSEATGFDRKAKRTETTRAKKAKA